MSISSQSVSIRLQELNNSKSRGPQAYLHEFSEISGLPYYMSSTPVRKSTTASDFLSLSEKDLPTSVPAVPLLMSAQSIIQTCPSSKLHPSNKSQQKIEQKKEKKTTLFDTVDSFAAKISQFPDYLDPNEAMLFKNYNVSDQKQGSLFYQELQASLRHRQELKTCQNIMRSDQTYQSQQANLEIGKNQRQISKEKKVQKQPKMVKKTIRENDVLLTSSDQQLLKKSSSYKRFKIEPYKKNDVFIILKSKKKKPYKKEIDTPDRRTKLIKKPSQSQNQNLVKVFPKSPNIDGLTLKRCQVAQIVVREELKKSREAEIPEMLYQNYGCKTMDPESYVTGKTCTIQNFKRQKELSLMQRMYTQEEKKILALNFRRH